MNCRQTRELISAYSDQELTGRQMLDISAHLSGCPRCAREWREINEVRRLLRSAFFHSPAFGAQERLMARVLTPEESAWSVFLSALLGPAPAASGQPPRGRRLATALAFSSLAVLIVAGPFAPQTRDAAGSGAGANAVLPAVVGASVFSLPTPSWGLAAQPSVRLTDSFSAPAAARPPAPADDAEAVSAADPGPLRDVTMSDYEQSAAAWNDASASDGSR